MSLKTQAIAPNEAPLVGKVSRIKEKRPKALKGKALTPSTTVITTRERILQVSLRLFNERGERLVTTNHIAAELVISPGNLYYYFKNKTEIIIELLKCYQNCILQVLTLPERPLTVNDKLNYYRSLNDYFWQYRFIHRDIKTLIEMTPRLKQQTVQFMQQVMGRARTIYQGFADAGLMMIAEDEIEALIINIWIVLSNWSGFLLMTGHLDSAQKETGAQDEWWIMQGLRQMIFLEKPYQTLQSQAVYTQLLKQYGGGEWFVRQLICED